MHGDDRWGHDMNKNLKYKWKPERIEARRRLWGVNRLSNYRLIITEDHNSKAPKIDEIKQRKNKNTKLGGNKIYISIRICANSALYSALTEFLSSLFVNLGNLNVFLHSQLDHGSWKHLRKKITPVSPFPLLPHDHDHDVDVLPVLCYASYNFSFVVLYLRWLQVDSFLHHDRELLTPYYSIVYLILFLYFGMSSLCSTFYFWFCLN